MKKLTKFFGMAVISAITANANAQASWTLNTDNVELNPATANVRIGGIPPKRSTKLFVSQSSSGTLLSSAYGIYSIITNPSEYTFSGYFTGGKFAVMDGNMGIGISTPQYPLDVLGTMKSTTGLFNNVGIGTTNPQYTLDVIGSGRFTGEFVVSGANNDGGSKAISIENPSKTGAEQATIWRFYNMAGSLYGNSFQIWNYGVNGSAGCNNGGLCANRFTITDNGNVGIGTMFPGVKLDVIGHIRATEVRVCLDQGCDFVFDKDYNLMPLNELSEFISANKHLPEVAPAAIMESEGINLSEMNAKLLQKVEELTLYVIDLQKQIDELKK